MAKEPEGAVQSGKKLLRSFQDEVFARVESAGQGDIKIVGLEYLTT